MDFLISLAIVFGVVSVLLFVVAYIIIKITDDDENGGSGGSSDDNTFNTLFNSGAFNNSYYGE